eukprot:6195466-Pleurochrysis_carterae.AAC.3
MHKRRPGKSALALMKEQTARNADDKSKLFGRTTQACKLRCSAKCACEATEQSAPLLEAHRVRVELLVQIVEQANSLRVKIGEGEQDPPVG